MIALFNNKKDEMINTINNFEYLDDKEKKWLLNFLDEFFVEISNPKRFISNLEYFCRDKDF